MALLRLSTTARLVAFLILTTLVISIELTVTHSSIINRYPVEISLAILFDLVFVITALFYWLVARPLRLPINRVMLVALLMVRIALLILPSSPVLPNQLWPLLLGAVECVVLVIMGVRIRTIVRTYEQFSLVTDAETALRMSLSSVFGERITGFMLGEGLVIYYALLGWRLRTDTPEKSMVLTTHRQSGQVALMITLLTVGLVEGVVVHLVVSRWSPIVAVWLTAVSGYGLLFFVADLIATIKRPSYLAGTQIHIRLGVRWRATISCNAIAAISFINEKPPKQTGQINGAFLTAPNVLLTFAEPIRFQGPYGIQRDALAFSFFVDDRQALKQQVAECK